MAGLLQQTNILAGVLKGAGVVSFLPCSQTQVILYTTEAPAQITWRTAGVFSNMYTRITVNAATGAGTVKFRKNAGNGNGSASVTANTTGEFQDSVNTDSVVAGDKVDYQWTVGTGGSTTLSIAATTFSATTNTVTRFANTTAGTNYATTNTNAFSCPVGSGAHTATESQTQYTMRMTGTFQNLQCNVSVNSRTDTLTFRFRKNTANGNQIISILTTQTGIFEDNANTDGVVSGDLVNYEISTAAGSGTLTFTNFSVELSSTANTSESITGSVGMAAVAANTTQFWATQGCGNAGTTELNGECKANAPYTASRLRITLHTNTVSATSTLTFRKNAGNGNETTSIGSNLSGLFEDTTNTDSVVATDEIDYQLALGATGTSMVVDLIGHLMTFASGGQYLMLLGVGS